MTRQDDERLVARLLETSGKRPEVPAEVQERIRAAADRAWRASLTRRRRHRRMTVAGVLAAAAVACVAALGSWFMTQSTPAVTFGVVEVVSGEVLFESTEGASLAKLAEGQVLSTGARLVTNGDSQAALALPSGASVRLDGGTHLRLVETDSVDLMAGALFVAGGEGSSLEGLKVVTPFGTVREIGTQFLVRISESTLVVSVREGAVEVTAENAPLRVESGQAIKVPKDGPSTLNSLESHDLRWEWVERVAPPFAAEGRSLGDFLKWYQRETGLTVEYEGEGAEAWAKQTLLHGDYGSLPPQEALVVVLAASECTSQDFPGGLVVRVPGTASRLGEGAAPE